MTTWRLWRALLHTQGTSHLFRRIYVYGRRVVGGITQEVDALRIQNRFTKQPLIHKLFSGIITLGGCLGLITGGILLIPAFILLLLFSGVIYGLRCAIDTGICIAEEREKRSYEVLSATPIGQFGINWAVCAGYLFRYQNFDLIRNIVTKFSLGLSIITATFLSVMILIIAHESPVRETELIYQIMPKAIIIIVIGLAIYLNFVQSVVTGSLIGILAPVYAGSRINAQLYAIFAFLFAVMTPYALAGITGFVILPQLINMLNIRFAFNNFVTPILQLLILYSVRELAIRLLWRSILAELNVGPDEVLSATQVAI